MELGNRINESRPACSVGNGQASWARQWWLLGHPVPEGGQPESVCRTEMPVDAVSKTETIFLFHQHLPPYVAT